MGGDYGGVDNEGSCFEKLHVQVWRQWARRCLGKATFESFFILFVSLKKVLSFFYKFITFMSLPI
jgi:hypothetical protein